MEAPGQSGQSEDNGGRCDAGHVSWYSQNATAHVCKQVVSVEVGLARAMPCAADVCNLGYSPRLHIVASTRSTCCVFSEWAGRQWEAGWLESLY
jgi:hypothetical protein